jgi:23S rRNA (cytidine1920-2'-O)/16S rRNA (cytidine1409-2'-O)-methyltransferase
VSDGAPRFVSRAGAKLAHALDAFSISPAGWMCADFGCNVGGFTDCLLQRGAEHVHAIDTGYGALAWTLRNDPRVSVRERTNALHADPPAGGADLVVIDMAWTPLRLSVPAALRWLEARGDPGAGLVIALIKPHYEAQDAERAGMRKGALPPEAADRVIGRVLTELLSLGVEILGDARSPLTGGKTGAGGNVEHLCALRMASRACARARSLV